MSMGAVLLQERLPVMLLLGEGVVDKLVHGIAGSMLFSSKLEAILGKETGDRFKRF